MRFYDRLVAQGDAVRLAPGMSRPGTIKGEPAELLPSGRRGDLYVRASIYDDVTRATGAGKKPLAETHAGAAWAQGMLAKPTAWSLAGLADNLTTLYRAISVPALKRVTGSPVAEGLLNLAPGGRLLTLVGDVGATLGRAMKDAVTGRDVGKALELAEAGALRSSEWAADPLRWTDALRPIRLGSKVLSRIADRVDFAARTRLLDAMKRAKASGLDIDTSPSAVSRAVNQMGRYSERAKSDLQKAFTAWSIQPFFEAFRTRTGNAGRTLAADLGVRGNTGAAEFKLRFLAATRLLGTMTSLGALNLITTGDAEGRPGVPFGAWDTGEDNEDGTPKTVDVFRFAGLRDLANVTGLTAYRDARRRGLGEAEAWRWAAERIGSYSLGAIRGPVPVGLSNAATGSLDWGMGQRVRPEFAPGTPLSERWLRGAGSVVGQMAPEVKIYAQGLDAAGVLPGALRSAFGFDDPDAPGLVDDLAAQLSHFRTGRGMSERGVATLPDRARYREFSDFLEDVRRRAKALPPAERRAFADALVEKHPPLSPKERGKLRGALYRVARPELAGAR
jgi:hypothetical protein